MVITSKCSKGLIKRITLSDHYIPSYINITLLCSVLLNNHYNYDKYRIVLKVTDCKRKSVPLLKICQTNMYVNKITDLTIKKICSGLEPVRRCEPSTNQPFIRWYSNCAIVTITG